MRAKILILGAVPPFEGPWVRISDADLWTPVVETRPVEARLNGQVRLEVETHGGRRFAGLKDLISGVRIRAIAQKVEDIDSITILVEAQGGT